MFLDALIDVGQFGIKAIILTVSVAVILIVLFNLIYRLRGQGREEIEAKDISNRLDRLSWQLKDKILSEKEMKQQLKKHKKDLKKESQESNNKGVLWVLSFKGDIKASAAENLSEEITSVLQVAKENDEIVVKIESPGGAVHGYGYAASQLRRIKDRKIPLTVCVDKVAASGGYMMACIADRILAAPFAIVGSIGVLAQVPNVNKLLKKYDIDYTEYTAGEYKRTISMLGENTEDGVAKFKDQLEQTHTLFKSWVKENRPVVDIDSVATGEYWYGRQALELKLIDEIRTSESYLLAQAPKRKIISVQKAPKKTLQDKVSDAMGHVIEKSLDRLLTRQQDPSSKTVTF